MKQCPRCASELNASDKVCPRCKLPVEKMSEAEEAFAEDMMKQAESEKLNKAQKKEKKRLAKLAKKETKRRKKEESRVSSTDFSKFATNAKNQDVDEINSSKRRKRKGDNFQFEIDENGEFHIDTKDVEIIGEETAKIYEERRNKQTYSLKKARGDYRPPKIKWWEIYKFADRAFARRKIKKDISKASKVKPDFVSKPKLLILALLFGWCGAHNFYAKNKKKGFTSLAFLLVSVFSVMLNNVPFFKTFELWLIGFTGFVVFMIWIVDVVDIIFNNFKFAIQRDKFISCMNIETRAKLGEKYIDLELLKKPWFVRFKVWCQKQKKNYHEWQQERRQRMIEKEKIKLAEQEEKDKIETEIIEFEKKELESIKEEKKNQKHKYTRKKSKDDSNNIESNEENIEKQAINKPKKAKISVKTKNSKKK